jgi:hypothetical protein
MCKRRSISLGKTRRVVTFASSLGGIDVLGLWVYPLDPDQSLVLLPSVKSALPVVGPRMHALGTLRVLGFPRKHLIVL